MSVQTEGSSTAGGHLTLVCTVETVEGVRETAIMVDWSGPGVTGERIDRNTNDTVSTSRLTFSHLLTTYGGVYTCTARIVAANAAVDVSNSDSMALSVTGECVRTGCLYHSHPSTSICIPPPRPQYLPRK